MSNGRSPRPDVTGKELDEAIRDLHTNLDRRLEQHGKGALSSSHEILGILTEEMHEYTVAVQGNLPDQQVKELLDIAVGAIFGVASIKAGKVDF